MYYKDPVCNIVFTTLKETKMIKKRKLYPITLGVMLLAGTGSVAAQEIEQGFYVAPSAGYYVFDGDNNDQADDAPLYGLSLGLQLNKNFAIEASYFKLESELVPNTGIDRREPLAKGWDDKDAKGLRKWRDYRDYEDAVKAGKPISAKNVIKPGVTQALADDGQWYAAGEDISADMYRIDGIFSLGLGSLSPYVAVGYTMLDPSPLMGDKNDMMDVALGIKKTITGGLFVRGDVRALHSFDNEDTDYSASLGVGYIFGKATGPAPVPVETKAPAGPNDEDKDGVTDDVDQCPGTPEGTTVDRNGCPDSDGDGVADPNDKCPGTPAGETVDADGCPVGLPKGSGEAVEITLEVLFDTNKAVVKSEFFENIQRVADFMRTYPRTTAEIEGHTDSKGSNAHNKRLSQRRADAVREVLVSKFGIDTGRLRAAGYGEERPIADNKTEAGRQKNRRVVATLRATQ
jgi:OOP family OmpA-OmpF porin